MIEAQILLFCVFAVVGGLVGGLTMLAVRRMRSPLDVLADYDTFRWAFRRYEPRVAALLVILAVVIPAILVGQRAAGGWQTYLLWRHAAPWHATDPLFHKDISFFVEVYPFHVAGGGAARRRPSRTACGSPSIARLLVRRVAAAAGAAQGHQGLRPS